MEGLVINMMEFYKNKNVFISGHTGFKGAWLSKMLINAGANVTGYSLASVTNPSLFDISKIEKHMNSIIGDIRDYESLFNAFRKAQPEIVIHLAAQPIVRDSYINPRYTYETNVMGTVNLLECIRNYQGVKSFLNVTTDKVYHNNEWFWGYRENDILDGHDPYSNSKSCSELVTNSYKRSFFYNREVAVSTARAGNVIGGGDFAKDRIIPDCIRAILNNQDIEIRNPFSTRPYQHVLEPLYAYLLILKKQYNNISISDSYNVGPDECDCVTTGEIVEIFCKKWEAYTGNKQRWLNRHDGGPHEANILKLDCSKLKTNLGWKPRWNIETTIEKIVEWTKVYLDNGDISAIMDIQIDEFLGGLK